MSAERKISKITNSHLSEDIQKRIDIAILGGRYAPVFVFEESIAATEEKIAVAKAKKDVLYRMIDFDPNNSQMIWMESRRVTVPQGEWNDAKRQKVYKTKYSDRGLYLITLQMSDDTICYFLGDKDYEFIGVNSQVA